MRGDIRPARLIRSWRTHLFAVALVLVAGCTESSGQPAPATVRGAATPSLNAAVNDCLLPPAGCYTPDLFRVGYGIQPLLDRGIDGRGETVTVLEEGPTPGEAPNDTDVRQDLKAFDSVFRMPAARIQVVTALANSAPPWLESGEEAGDLEELHMIAPAATLRVVVLPTDVMDSAKTATADMIAGLRLAVSGTDVALVTWSLGAHFFTKAQVADMHAILAGATAHHVTVIANSGDTGAFSDTPWGGTSVTEVSLPASDPLVLATGGTTLTANPSSGAYISETVWNTSTGFVQPGGASGGGFSRLYTRPAYQDGVRGIGAMRGVPDVAGDADAQGGAPLVFPAGSTPQIVSASGTAAAAPLWAGLMALVDQDAHHDLGFVNPAIYRIARSSRYHQAFHDVTTGNNTMTMPYPAGPAGYQATPGWDPATGWGSPDAQVLVPLLAA